ncbi:putative gustatory receptor 28a [Microplitis mediator]|uniref:putative gustatory receptor 28a n=1 Tax=Microplitis mediator TaxID=375433 RepID=UPI0025556851|nr:putative gustatory receptor 28a [Microplitis mediator]
MLPNIFDFVICLHIFQYALILAIIKIKYENLYSKLSELTEIYNGLQVYTTVITGKNKYSRTLLQLTTIRRNYAVLSDICDDISQLYGVSILFSLTYAFGIIVYYSYLAISNSIIDIHEKSFIYTIDAVLPLIGAVLAVTAICVLANDVIAQMRKVIDVIYQLLNVRNFHREIKTELEIFALEVSHREISFQACSMFSIDCGLLGSIFSVTATYLILLLQFYGSSK